MSSVTELLLLPDGQVLVHNLTPAMAALLKEFDLQDTEIALRASLGSAGPKAGSRTNESTPPVAHPGAISKARKSHARVAADVRACCPTVGAPDSSGLPLSKSGGGTSTLGASGCSGGLSRLKSALRPLGNKPVSRRILAAAKIAPTAVGGYTLSTNRAECETSGLVSPSGSKL
jgi:hypothetical protein